MVRRETPESLKKGATFVGALAIACLMLAALTYSLAGRWFTFVWWVHVTFVVVSFVVCIRTGFSDTTNALQRSSEAAIARILARLVVSPRAIALLYLLPPTIGELAATVIVGFGFYHGAVYYAEGSWIRADCVLFVTWLLWSLVKLPASAMDKIRLVAERSLDGREVGFRWPRLGRALQWGGGIISFPSAVLMLIIYAFLAYAVVFSESLTVRYYAVVASVTTLAFVQIGMVAYEVGIRLQTAPVQRMSDITWEVPTGLLLRSFVDDNAGFGVKETFIRFTIEQAIASGCGLRLGLTFPLRQWLTLLRPGQRFVAGGMQRVTTSDEEWKAWVSDAITRAAIVVVMLGNTSGLEWELQECARVSELRKLRVVVLPQDELETRQKMFALLRSVWGAELQIPQLPRTNTQVVSFWWDEGILREEKVSYNRGWNTVGGFVFASSSR